MAEVSLSEIRMMSFAYAPRGWARCDGATLSIQQNQALFALLGTSFGGNGTTTFCLPDLRGRTPVHMSPQTRIGGTGGQESVALSMAQVPLARHELHGLTTDATATKPAAGVGLAKGACYAADGTTTVGLHPQTVEPFTGGQSHENRQPYATLSFCIALTGLWPSRD